jgi:hypothetical protein
MANYHPDVAWDGQYLWFANHCDYNAERAVFQLDPQDGRILKEFRNDWIERAGDDGFGLEYSKGTLHLSQGSGYNRLIIIDASTGAFIKETPLPGWPRGGMALTKNYPSRELWIGTVIGSYNIAKIDPTTGYIHSLFPIDNPISGLAWNGLNLFSIDGGGIVKAYDITSPCNPNIITIQPWSNVYCQTQNPTFTWTSECSDSFIVDFSPNADFSDPQVSFSVENRTKLVLQDGLRDRFPYNVNQYWRIRSFTGGEFSKQSDVRVIKKYYDPLCW